MLNQSPGDAVRSIASAMPGGYFVAWLVGIPVEKWAALAALAWSLGLMWQNWLWRPWLKSVWLKSLWRKRSGE